MTPDTYLLRVPLSAEALSAMDDAVARRLGGHATRASLVSEAVLSYIAELRYPPAPPEPTAESSPKRGRSRPEREENPATASEPRSSISLSETALGPVPPCEVISHGVALVSNEPLFGMHNRDYPSIWAAHKLATLTRNETIPFETFLAEVAQEAWKLGSKLEEFDSSHGTKSSVLFPTNASKAEAAESGFRNFVVGSLKQADSKLLATGPLFLWAAIQVSVRNKDVVVGLTERGLSLLASLDGISLALPHIEGHTRAFMAHLKSYASADYEAFVYVLGAVRDGIGRPELIRSMQSHWPEWTAAQASTNASGYIGRAREWGLVESKMAGGKYTLTDFGEAFLQECGREN